MIKDKTRHKQLCKQRYERVKKYKEEFRKKKENLEIPQNMTFSVFLKSKKNWEVCPFCKDKYELRKNPKTHSRRCPRCLKYYEV